MKNYTFNNLFYSVKVKPFIWTVLLFEGIKMTAFNRPNTERYKRLQIINRKDCYLEYLPSPAASRDPEVTLREHKKDTGGSLCCKLCLQRGRVWCPDDSPCDPLWLIVEFTVRGRSGLAWSHSRQDNAVWPLTIILTAMMFHLSPRIINININQTSNTIQYIQLTSEILSLTVSVKCGSQTWYY